MRFPGFIGPSYTLESKNVDCQRCVNLFPEINALGTGKEKEIAALVPTQGKRLLLTLADSPIRGSYTASNGEFYAVGGQKLYSISSLWVATEIGTLATDSGPVSMADNGIELVLVDGTDGFVWNMDTDTFTEITDPDFYPADRVDYQDGYFIFNKSGTGQWFISGINSTDIDGLDIATAEGSPDIVIGHIVSNQNIYVFGSQSLEVYYNSGDADFPFTRIQGAVVDVGCAAAFSIAKQGSEVYFLGGDENGFGIVYRMRGYQAQRISTYAIEQKIRSLTPSQISAATAYTYQQAGHTFYCLNIPGLHSTWVYDSSTEFWHERQYLTLWSLERDRAENHAVAFGLNVVGDFDNGKIYTLDPDYFTDDETPIVRIRSAPHLSSGLKLVRHNSFQLDMEAGVGLNGLSDPFAGVSEVTRIEPTFSSIGALFAAFDDGGGWIPLEDEDGTVALWYGWSEPTHGCDRGIQILTGSETSKSDMVASIIAAVGADSKFTAVSTSVGSSPPNVLITCIAPGDRADATDAHIGQVSFAISVVTQGIDPVAAVQGANPKAILRWSDDGGHTWSNDRSAEIGKIGERNKRTIWRRLGSSRDRVYEVRVSDPVKVVLIGAEISLEEGTA
jgi:hypothetical protein